MTATAGIKALRKVQLGRQTSFGTSVAATTIYRAPAVMQEDMQSKIKPEENVGISAALTRQITVKKYASIKFPTHVATFQQLHHPFEGGIKAVTAASDGVGTGKIYAYPLPYQDSNTTKFYTVEAGDNKIEEYMEDAFALEITLEGKINDTWKLSHTWGGKQSTVSSFTGSLSIPSVSEMIFNKSKLYIDNVGGTLGGTQIVNSWIGATIKITTGLKAQFTGDGNLYYSFMDFIGAKCSVDLTFLTNATTLAERVLWRSDTPRQMRILCEGNALTTPGTTYTKETFRADIAGVYSSFGPPNDESEGSNVMKATFEGGYDATAALFANFTIVDQLASVP